MPMLAGFSGNLISEQFADTLADGLYSAASFRNGVCRWWRRHVAAVGPASPPRLLHASAVELLSLLGFRSVPGLIVRNGAAAGALAPGVALLAPPWEESLDLRWRDAVRQAIETESRWCFAFNGRRLRLVDAQRTYARRHLEFDLPAAQQDERTVALMQAILNASAVSPSLSSNPGSTSLDSIVEQSARETLAVCRSLKGGVLDALGALMEGLLRASRRRRPDRDVLDVMHAQALTLIYRLLFLLFAEARRLVPSWHPVYRDSYSLDTLCSLMQTRADTPAVWETLQAIWRLAHAGCDADDLCVTAFNGRLFSPRETPLGERLRVDDRYARRAVLAVAVSPGSIRQEGPRRIAYRDLGVEELGSVYENVLDFTPEATPGALPGVALRPGRMRRKTTGSFYTPRSLTDFLVRRTLHPLVANANPESILRLRIVDPAMGSGAFLVAACRYLAHAYEQALVRTNRCGPAEIDEGDRARFRRLIAQRCLFGVDLNPMAVQLARLSLWLTTLAANRPLSFLDHRLIPGDSLVGASPEDIRRQPPGASAGRSAPLATLPLFETDSFQAAVQHVLPVRVRLAEVPDDSAATVHEKDRTLRQLRKDDSPWSRWLKLADLWCACWFWDDESRPGRAEFLELADHVTGGGGLLPGSLARRLLDRVGAIAQKRQFCHWRLQFPEVFFEGDGSPRADAGFDAVLGNPPWEMVREDDGARLPPSRAERASASRAEAFGGGGKPGTTTETTLKLGPTKRVDAPKRCGPTNSAQMVRFIRSSGVYREHQDGHPNQYQLFAERALHLARPGGRIGLVLPWGFASDTGSAPLRRLVLQRSAIDTMVGFDNTNGIFPIHRSVRFLLLTATKGPAEAGLYENGKRSPGREARAGRTIRCRFGERDPSVLDDVADSAADDGDPRWLALDVRMIERISGPDLSVPYLRTRDDFALVERLCAAHPALGDARGWGAEFGRELNATDDREYFTARRGARRALPVLDGKHLEPFVARVSLPERVISVAHASRLVDPRRTYRRPRLAYRDVASATNQLTLIAAVAPRGCLTTHTLFCLRTALRRHEQDVLCALLNSYVANYLARLWVSSHVTVGIMRRLPVPRPDADSEAFRDLATLSRRLASRPLSHSLFETDDYIRLQCLAAKLYQLTPTEFEYLLESFPLIPEATRRESLHRFGVKS
ncbi:MAG: N-6 DNA methylase [Acidobacteria bacterium]|nr:N-6 DNA methylase [Acidobacteriota bacterium]